MKMHARVGLVQEDPAEQSKPEGRKKPKVIAFSGYEWTVKSGKQPLGPGPNYFSASEKNVWLDDKGRLHLKMTQKDGIWYCAEVDAVKSLGYGKYVFHVEGGIDRLDKNVVLGLFTYDCGAEKKYYREIDIEFAKWGKAKTKPGLYSVVPGWVKGNRVGFDFQLAGILSVHSFDWKTDSICFQSLQGKGAGAKEIKSWNHASKYVHKPGKEKAMINLWLFEGQSPSDAKEVEVVIRKFEFVPAQK
ncbi:MAG: glycoside hydrolase family 16 protein [Verrucomicrobia bacterium]|nr:glycoside hydrolase family 16 protein [Verrucomicrobiota bacterium]MBU4289938.1 glycoside hydrolase family 16 protein [Verrucomicrobiota bacterium]MBU4428090.1 glycoside hydrolase family 16 protein [Verrucomicrobiota bacterium]MCG2678356.1 glycoside hydrolase family 16 protein [Kiritimatiellia bacterium]